MSLRKRITRNPYKTTIVSRNNDPTNPASSIHTSITQPSQHTSINQNPATHSENLAPLPPAAEAILPRTAKDDIYDWRQFWRESNPPRRVNKPTNPSTETVELHSNDNRAEEAGNQHQRLHQTTLTHTSEQGNGIGGDPLNYSPEKHIFRHINKNVNTLNDKNKWHQWKAASLGLEELSAGSFTFQETNMDWTADRQQQATNILRKTHSQAIMATSTSDEDTSLTSYKRGGTATGVMGKWTGRHIDHGSDSTGLGRWSYIIVAGKEAIRIVIVSVYRPCQSAITQAGTTSAYMQQTRLLQEQGITNPKPRQQCLDDLLVQVDKWKKLKYDIHIGMDSNEDIRTPNSKLAEFVSRAGLIHLYADRHGQDTPATYHRGTKTLDYFFGTRRVASAVIAIGYLEFGANNLLKGDHRTGFVDYDERILFGTATEDMLAPPSRGVHSNRPNVVKKFSKMVLEKCVAQTYHQRAQKIYLQRTWTPEDHIEMDEIYQGLHDAMNEADKKCLHIHRSPWTPEIHKAEMIFNYWCLRSTAATTTRDYSVQITERELQIPAQDRNQGDPTRSTRAQIRHARKTLNAERLKGAEKRKEFLLSLQETAAAANETKRAKILSNIAKSEAKTRCYLRIRRHTKPHQGMGGLSYVKVPDPQGADPQNPTTTWRSIHDSKEMERVLLEQSKAHFSQAEGTPFTNDPVRSLVGYDGLTEYATNILEGTAEIDNLDTDQYTKLFLHKLESVRNPLLQADSFTFLDMAQGFKKWRESTTTSPNGNHLGQYKALLKDTRQPKQQDDTEIPEIEGGNPEEPVQCGTDVMMILFYLLQTAVRANHVYANWKIIHNFVLEKVPGNPMSHRLRWIHLYDACYNLLLKWYMSRQLSSHAEQHDSHVDEQNGGRAGRSAIDGALKKELLYELIRLRKLTAANADNDATACYDRIVESVGNMACRRQGCCPEILALHSKVLSQVKYHLKHKFGISQHYNCHTDKTPFHGSGQGAGDSPPRWGFISATAIGIYNDEADRWEVHHPDGTMAYKAGIDAFVDDQTMLLVLDSTQSLATLLQAFQNNVNIWNGVLHSTGGKINCSKSCWSLFLWGFDEDGRAFLREPNEDPVEIFIRNHSTDELETLRKTTTSEATKLLGVQITMDGNTTAQQTALRTKCQLFGTALRTCPLSREDAYTVYQSVYIPSITYPLAATFIPAKDLDNLERPALNGFLPIMGFNRNMTRAIALTPIELSGCGLRTLSREQGISQAIHLIKHCRASTTLGTTLQVLVATYQMSAGIAQPVLEDTQELKYLEDDSKWITNLRKFLNQSTSQIVIQDPWVVQPVRENDCHLMDRFIAAKYSPKTLGMLNRVRIFLQVTTLSDIVDHTGTQVLRCAQLVTSNDLNEPTLWNFVSTPTWQWPHQPKPGTKSINAWKRAISKTFLNPNNKLSSPLGALLQNWNNLGRQWHHFYDPASYDQPILFSTKPSGNIEYHQVSAQRHYTVWDDPIPSDVPIKPTALPVHPQPRRKQVGLAYPLPRTIISQQPRLPPPHQPPTFQEYINNLPTWERQLFAHHRAWPRSRVSLEALLRSNDPIFMCSDAATHDTRCSYAWVIATSKSLVHEGVALVPRDRATTKPRRAESYGMLAVFRYLAHFIKFHDIHLGTNTLLYVCDNQGLITTLRWMQECISLYPTHRLIEDYDVRIAIHNSIKTLGILPELQHVKGHQERGVLSEAATALITAGKLGRTKVLPWVAQLNVYCDHSAKQFLRLNSEASPRKTPQIPDAKIHVKIEGQIVPNNLAAQLRRSSARPVLYQHLCKRFPEWTTSTCKSIDWTIVGKTIRRFRRPDQQRIQKLIHGWLAVNARQHLMTPYHSPQCPSCGHATEDIAHFMYCPNLKRKTLWITCLTKIRDMSETLEAPAILLNMLCQALVNPQTFKQDPPQGLPPEYVTLYTTQSAIGWDQVAYGRLSRAWEYRFEMSYRSRNLVPPKSGISWLTEVMTIFWRHFLTVWETRNQDQHGLELEEQERKLRARLRSQVHILFNQRMHLLVHSRHIYGTYTVDTLLEKHIKEIQTWIHIARPFIKKQLVVAKKQLKARTHDIRDFFPSASHPP